MNIFIKNYCVIAHSGNTKGSILKTMPKNTYVAIVTIKIPTMLITNPVRIILFILTLSVPKIIAFGGVAVGSINANDAASVTGTINIMGFIFKPTAIEAKTGKSICVEAVFEVNSVRKVISPTIIRI